MSGPPRNFIKKVTESVGKSNVVTDPAECWTYGYDNSRKHAPPDAVAFPEDHAQIKTIVQLCNEFNIPLVARGSGTNTAGGTVPLAGGLVLSLERMNAVIQFEPDDRFIRVQTGITNHAVQEAVSGHGLFWAPDPTSAAICTVGGNLAMNAAGPRSLKYGSTRDNVLGLRAVTGSGNEINAGVRTSKGVVGYDLVRLLIGSEGTLGIITEATLKLLPVPQVRQTLQATYKNINSACDAVVNIMKQPVTPAILEFMDAAAIDITRNYPDVSIPDDVNALLMIEVDGLQHSIDETVKIISNAADNDGLIDLIHAQTEEETNHLWSMRKALSPALRKIAPNKVNEDIVVPVTRIPALIEGLDKLSKQYQIPIVNFGHAGNGNIHVNLLYDGQDPVQSGNAEPCLSMVFDLVLDLGGTLSGEHGIGKDKREFIAREIDSTTLDLMWQIRKQFDPRGILNPGKIFPAEFWRKRPD